MREHWAECIKCRWSHAHHFRLQSRTISLWVYGGPQFTKFHRTHETSSFLLSLSLFRLPASHSRLIHVVAQVEEIGEKIHNSSCNSFQWSRIRQCLAIVCRFTYNARHTQRRGVERVLCIYNYVADKCHTIILKIHIVSHSYVESTTMSHYYFSFFLLHSPPMAMRSVPVMGITHRENREFRGRKAALNRRARK